eukprot:CAMPEP_0183343164 /NCGR_PEP_ID=MMETSP0164_2-20130417/9134_1 /TAXON_ID=221442 /ORGANISM="Coccolithus pelagicus ssp braarudi, Strain PLY182g" /LENGTH=45 /DNA_ID= /DNA_START= /DNA_END= /DNA_ORIENTATION=
MCREPSHAGRFSHHALHLWHVERMLGLHTETPAEVWVVGECATGG